MIHRLQRGQIPSKPHTAFRPEGELAFEHCFTRQGFDGTYSILYHRQPPHWLVQQEDMGKHPGHSPLEQQAQIQRCHFQTGKLENGGSPFLGRKLLLGNRDLQIWFGVAEQSEPSLVCNSDGDELVYIYRGKGQLHSAFGVVPFQAEDYVFIPRGVVHHWVVEETVESLVLEGLSWIDLPQQFRNQAGQLKMDAPYSHRDFKEPLWPPQPALSNEVITKRQDHLTRLTMNHDPFDVWGWDGQVWPFAFPIRAFQPRTGLVHLPPTVHATFAGGGFLVCSFVPRVVDFHPEAIPCPYPHSSVDCDEMLFYVDGNFTSRKGITSGSISLHPRGLPHGPHPGTYEASIGSQRTDELAVMIDTFQPLYPTAYARVIEEAGYQFSWTD